MPAIDLTQGPHTLSRYNVVGQWAEDQTHFVIHVGMLDEDSRSGEVGGKVSAVHMRPPLEQGDAITVHVAGCVPLTNDEVEKISTWVKKISDEYPRSSAKQYVIHPPWKDEYDPNTGVRRYRRYSCAGFVLDGHLQVDIQLLRLDDDALPEVDKQTIMSAYPDLSQRPRLLSQFGLKGDGPWKVVLAWYIMHALNRSSDQIRQESYRAKEGDEQF